MEANYKSLPNHLHGKMLLYWITYSYLKSKKLIPMVSDENPTEIKFSDFLRLKDFEAFKHFFNIEREHKDVLLGEIRPLCEKAGFSKEFNEGLLNYFVSDLSEVSDLKYILNRINNKKLEFHMKNQDMYEILVEALKRKMKMGTGSDIPLAEVLIYIESIPLKSTTTTG